MRKSSRRIKNAGIKLAGSEKSERSNLPARLSEKLGRRSKNPTSEKMYLTGNLERRTGIITIRTTSSLRTRRSSS